MSKATKGFTPQDNQTTGDVDLSSEPCLQDDQLMEAVLENINTTPLGQVLKRIAQQTCIRKGKVFNVCKQLHDGSYDLDERLDAVIDKVLDQLSD